MKMKVRVNLKGEISQFKKPYDSTIQFEKFLLKNKVLSKNTTSIVDVGTGLGANLNYFSNKYKKIKFTGTDYNKKNINFAKKINKNSRVKFYVHNILRSTSPNLVGHDIMTCIHTLCCFKELNKPLRNMCKMKPKWIAINSLFYDGPLDVLIHIRDHNNRHVEDYNPDSDFNIFSISNVSKVLKRYGYKIYKVKEFFPLKRIPKKKGNARGSYTIKTQFNKFTTFSGPVYLPWHFIIAKRIKKNDRK